MGGHHLILGETRDFLTGEVIEDTHDERYRQKLARWLARDKGFSPSDIAARHPLTVRAGDKTARIWIDFLVSAGGGTAMLVKYGPGSLVTRRKPALAMARLTGPRRVPVVVVTNGEDAEILSGLDGRVMGTGLNAIPDCETLARIAAAEPAPEISPEEAEMAARIVYCYEIDGACPCDDTVCRL